VAKAFGVPIDTDPRALAILHEWVKTTGAEMNEARLRLTRIPKGADLILYKVSGAPGFWIGNVIVMAGVPSIMQAMLRGRGDAGASAARTSRAPEHRPLTAKTGVRVP
jgi:molybdopterin-biosynthesis enzyme MoeA-like protein